MKHFLFSTMVACTVLGLAACQSSASDSASDKPESQENVAYQNIMTRYSVRDYQENREVARDTIEMLLRAGMAAPTAVNSQPWKFVVLTGEPLKAFKDSMQYREGMNKAPLAIVVCGDSEKFLDGEEARNYWVQDCSAATENILLAANALGLGSVWTGVYPISERTAKVSKLLELPSNLIPLDAILIGYPAGEPTIKDKWLPDNVIWK